MLLSRKYVTSEKLRQEKFKKFNNGETISAKERSNLLVPCPEYLPTLCISKNTQMDQKKSALVFFLEINMKIQRPFGSDSEAMEADSVKNIGGCERTKQEVCERLYSSVNTSVGESLTRKILPHFCTIPTDPTATNQTTKNNKQHKLNVKKVKCIFLR